MQVGRYRMVRELGRGGMAAAFLAEAPGGQLVVMKVPLDDDPARAARLRDEARVGSRLAHPNIVETLDLFEHDGRPVLIVAHIEGLSVEELRRRRKAPLPADAVCRIGRQLASALAALHAAEDEHGRHLEIVHRDVSGPNVLVDLLGDARLIDLGIARSVENEVTTTPDLIKGTIRYLAPELFSGERASPRSDLWGLGCVLLESATGAPCFKGTAQEVAAAILGQDVMTRAAIRAIHPGLREVLASLLERDPAKRAADASDVARRLDALAEELGDGRATLASAVAQARAGALPAREPAAPPPVRKPPQPAAPPPPRFDRPGRPHERAGPPPSPFEQPTQLELEERSRRSTRALEVPNVRSPYPEPARKGGGGLKIVGGIALVVALAFVAVVYGRPYLASRAAAQARASQERALEEERLLRGGGELPDCWRGGEGNYFVYRGPDGSDVVVESISQVPKRYRKKARCVKADR